MNKLHLVYGALIGIAATVAGSLAFLQIAFPGIGIEEGIKTMKYGDQLGKVITIGAILNLLIFFLLLKAGKEMMARGIILGTLLMAIFTIFV